MFTSKVLRSKCSMTAIYKTFTIIIHIYSIVQELMLLDSKKKLESLKSYLKIFLFGKS